MKGVIASCLAEVVTAKYGKAKWEAVLAKAGLPLQTVFLAPQDIDDAAVLKVVNAACEVLHLTLPQAADAFGDYWMTTFAPRIYQPYFRGAKNAREFLLNMERVHIQATKTIADAHPPGFEYHWEDDQTLIMVYRSPRALIDFVVGLAKGVGTYFHEQLEVKKLSPTEVRVRFI
jgi:hypothetical protein